jgi:hypothetical protein
MSPRVSGEVRTLRAGALHSRGSRGWGGRHSRGVARVLGLCPRDAGSDSKLSLGQHIDAPYRQIARQCRLVRERVAELPQPATTAICAFAALRLMAEHASWPQEEQNTFVLAWGPVLQLILQALIAPSAQTRTRLPLQSTRWRSQTRRGIPLQARAATGALLLVDAAAFRADRSLADLMSHEAKEREAKFQQEEIDRPNDGFSLLEREGVTTTSIEGLGRTFSVPAR